MTGCWSEGELRAYLDRELASAGMEAIRVHLAECPNCAIAYEDIAGRAARVQALMGDLEVVPATRPVRQWRWAAAAALAAAVLLAILLIPRHGARKPVMVVPAVIPAELPQPEPRLVTVADVPPPAATQARSVRHRKPGNDVQYYIPLDDDPIDTGLVMRVALAGGIQADVIVDSAGRPRAIRPIQ
jgi:hypothetical protein